MTDDAVHIRDTISFLISGILVEKLQSLKGQGMHAITHTFIHVHIYPNKRLVLHIYWASACAHWLGIDPVLEVGNSSVNLRC